MSTKIALVTGANRGIGFEVAFEIARAGYHVLVGARSSEKAKAAAEELKKRGVEVEPVTLDTSDPKSIEAACKAIIEKHRKVDVLVNNAGIFLDDLAASAATTDLQKVKDTFQTNTLGPLLLCQRLVPLMVKNGSGRVVNVSSGMGQLDKMEGGSPAYRISKTALNAVTKIFAAETAGKNVLVNSVCPGWVRTDMGGANAHRSVEKGAETIVWAATSPALKTSGGFFRDKEPIHW